MKRIRLLQNGVLLIVLVLAMTAWQIGSAATVVLPENSNTIGVLRDGESFLEFGFLGWGPNWQYLGFRGNVSQVDNRSQLTSSATVRATGAKVRFDISAQKLGGSQFGIDVNLSTDRDTDLTTIVATVALPKRAFSEGKVLVVDQAGKKSTVKLPLGRQGLGNKVSQFTLVDSDGRKTVVSLNPACDVQSDGQVRIVLAGERITADRPRRVQITVSLPEELIFYASSKSVPDSPDLESWYPFHPDADYDRPAVIGLERWLDAPAGKHGRIVSEGERLMVGGKPIRLWGLNVCYSSCAPDKQLAEKRAKFYARYGINSVRLHKYADGTGWAGIQSKESFVEFDPTALDRMDYFVAQLKKRGIYVLLSSTFGVKLGPKDRQVVPYMAEFGSGRGRGRVETGHGSVYLARELQDLQIRQVAKLLAHRNPYTGIDYAKDPAVAVVELFNEDSALFFGTLDRLRKIPTLRKRASIVFCKWLKTKYGTKEGLLKAWGDKALNSFGNEGLVGESWEEQTIVPAGNPWFFDPEQLAGSQKVKRQRLLDTMLFLYEIQNNFYVRYVAAIRETGYEGEILGSNWQAGRALSHYYNLHSDSLVGLIDRHNYFGGGRGGKIDNASMLRIPGSGMLSAGMQQVADRPFMLSEWVHVTPNEWGVEGPAIIGAYGMGLQGWDASYLFQNRDNGQFAEQIGKSQWEVVTPQILGVLPAVSRHVLRGDVKESDLQVTRYVHVPSLHEGKIGFEDRVTQQHDVKTFNCDKVPVQTLAVARTVVRFSDTFRATPMFDIRPFLKGHVLTSSTGQLRWREGQSKLDGFFTIDTDATKGVVGFARDQQCRLGSVTIIPKSRFGAIYVTALEKDKTIVTSKNLLVVAIARARNTGMKVFEDCRLLDRGRPPIVMEPVKAVITIRKPEVPTVILLDHSGRRTSKTLPGQAGTFTIDGARDRTPYYLITFR